MKRRKQQTQTAPSEPVITMTQREFIDIMARLISAEIGLEMHKAISEWKREHNLR